jgi:hypothetical protein
VVVGEPVEAAMSEAAHEETTVAADPLRCYELAAAFEAYPTWAKEVHEATVVARDDAGRATRVEYRAAALGRTVRYVLDYDYSEAPHALTWTLVEGDMLRALDGRYAFDPDGAGTRVGYDLRVDLAVPMPGLLKRRASGVIVNSALRDLKRTVEAALAEPEKPLPPMECPETRSPVPPSPESNPDPVPSDSPGRVHAHPDAVGFDAAGSEERSLPAPSVLESVISELLGAVPEVRDHVLEAADALIEAAKALIDAADRVVRQQRGDG